MPHLQPPIVPPTMRLIEQIPNLCLYDIFVKLSIYNFVKITINL